MLHSAIIFAATAHNTQLRKGTNLPYIIHPMEVLQILSTVTSNEEILVAGVLHDVLEDTEVSFSELSHTFGSKVAFLVEACSNTHQGNWHQRKASNIIKMQNTNSEIAIILCADKISNLRSIVFDFNAFGDLIWNRFSARKEDIIWYYNMLGKAIENRRELPLNFRDEYTTLLSTLNRIASN